MPASGRRRLPSGLRPPPGAAPSAMICFLSASARPFLPVLSPRPFCRLLGILPQSSLGAPSATLRVLWSPPLYDRHSLPVSLLRTQMCLPSDAGAVRVQWPRSVPGPPPLGPDSWGGLLSAWSWDPSSPGHRHRALFPPQGEPGEAGEPGLPGEGGPPVSGLGGGVGHGTMVLRWVGSPRLVSVFPSMRWATFPLTLGSWRSCGELEGGGG